MEIWKSIKHYENLYMVSNRGDVKALNYNNTGTEKLLKPYKTSTGYYKVTLSKDKTKKIIPVHRLVAEAFIPNPNSKQEINHIDGNKANNSETNLEWTTRSENTTHAIKSGLVTRHAQRPIKQKDIESNVVLKTYKSMCEAERLLGIRHEGISACVRGKKNDYAGYKWSY